MNNLLTSNLLVKAIIIVLALTFSKPLLAIEASLDKLTAVYIYQLSRYITWPESEKQMNEFQICFINSQNNEHIIDNLKNKKLHDKNVSIKNISNSKDINHCKVLYVANFSDSKKPEIVEILESAKNKPILTLSNLPGFIEDYGIVELHIEKNRLKYSINYKRSQKAKLVLDSRLLQLAVKIIR